MESAINKIEGRVHRDNAESETRLSRPNQCAFFCSVFLLIKVIALLHCPPGQSANLSLNITQYIVYIAPPLHPQQTAQCP